MGYNTSLYILNDGFHIIRENPEEFFEKLTPFVNGGRVRDRKESSLREIGEGDAYFGVGNYANVVGVIDVAHADATQVMMVGGNHATLLGEAYYTGGHHTRAGVKEALNQVLKQYDLQVVERRKK